MSSLAVDTLTPSKLLSGGGDGVRNNPQKSLTTKRTPVPSCRRFATRLRADATPNKKIEKALIQVTRSAVRATPKKATIPRSQSMAELAPSMELRKKRLIDGDAGVRETPKKQRNVDAGHLIYQQLVLNAWRRRRAQVSTLLESCDQFKAQISQLQIQVDVLQKLRESECKRRDSSVSENQTLRTRIQELEEANKCLCEAKTATEELLKDKEQQVDNLKINIENVRNELIAMRSELRVSEQQLEKERNKIYSMREEAKILKQKEKQDEKCIALQKQKISVMIDEHEIIKRQLQDVIDISNSKDEEISAVLLQLKTKEQEMNTIKNKLESAENRIEKLNKTITAFKRNLCEMRQSKEKVVEENEELKRYVHCLEEVIREERRKPWWKTAKQLMSTPMSMLQNAAYIMLPALPPPDNSSSSQ